MMYELYDSPKMLKEAMCTAQWAVANMTMSSSNRNYTLDVIQRLIDECDRHRPIGVNGKHSNLHTETCGCEDKGPRETWATVTLMEKGPQIDSKNELCPKDGRPLWWHVSIGGEDSRGFLRTNGQIIDCDFGANDTHAVLEAQLPYGKPTSVEDLPLLPLIKCNICFCVISDSKQHEVWHRYQESPNDICVIDNYTRDFHEINCYGDDRCKFKRG